ncbi:T9SS type A sorting domain-containing protein [bacterium]|nr:T9SS type A sorting domain-containing protein [bacterium]
MVIGVKGTPGTCFKTAVGSEAVYAGTFENLLVAPRQCTVTAVPETAASATQLVLHSAAPNPFNPVTVLTWEQPVAGPVRLRVYDVAGRVVRTLVGDAYHAAGEHRERWEGRDESGRPVAAGVYLARLEVGGEVASRRLVLVR